MNPRTFNTYKKWVIGGLILVIVTGIGIFRIANFKVDGQVSSNEKKITINKINIDGCEDEGCLIKIIKEFGNEQSEDRRVKIAQVITSLYNPENLAGSLSSITKIYEESNRLSGDCHGVLQRAGEDIYEKYGVKSLELLNTEFSVCRSMLKVGVLIGAKDELTAEVFTDKASKLCITDPEKNGCADGIGQLIFLKGLDASYVSKACEFGARDTAAADYFLEGCIGGYVNWARFSPIWNMMESIEGAPQFCAKASKESYKQCLGYALRTYVRAGLENDTSIKKLEEMIDYCGKNKDITATCQPYLGFVIADVYNASPTGEGNSKPEVIAKVLERVCGKDQSGICLTSFVSWYMNQWGFTDHSQFDEVKVKVICDNLVRQKELCIRQVSSEVERFNNRVILEGAENSKS